MSMRALAPFLIPLALAGAVLSGCGQQSAPASGTPAATTPAAAAPGDPNAETLGERYIDLLPQWVPIANTFDGGSLSYDLKALKKPVDGVTEITLQVLHGAPQQATVDEGVATITITYQREIVRLRYRCPARQFAIVYREVPDGAGGAATRETTPDAPFQPIDGNGVATIAYNPACAER